MNLTPWVTNERLVSQVLINTELEKRDWDVIDKALRQFISEFHKKASSSATQYCCESHRNRPVKNGFYIVFIANKKGYMPLFLFLSSIITHNLPFTYKYDLSLEAVPLTESDAIPNEDDSFMALRLGAKPLGKKSKKTLIDLLVKKLEDVKSL